MTQHIQSGLKSMLNARYYPANLLPILILELISTSAMLMSSTNKDLIFYHNVLYINIPTNANIEVLRTKSKSIVIMFSNLFLFGSRFFTLLLRSEIEILLD